ncbi:MAG: hypothetical protein KDC73_01320 [Ignavibacteriae bacterium]|nr:hypothetical protein [Ignavibacteriota bacterium]MCB0723315.1 hypothetical protein [Ignavibacteriota bacterium]MCB9243161.1 hypothetical protein [Ignavibacteriales bacterium]
MSTKEILKSTSGKIVEILNRDSDPTMWIVSVYKRILFFKKKVASEWFSKKEDALEFANNIK